MKKNLRKLLVVSSLFVLAACGSKKPVDPTPTPEPPAPEPTPEQQIDVRFTGYYGGTYDVKMPYNDELFIKNKSNQAINDLIIQSFGFAVSADTNVVNGDYSQADAHLRYYLTNAGFNTLYTNPDYNARPTIDSIGYGFGLKELSDGDKLLAITVRGGGYEAEWGNNFTIGETGAHKGFASRTANLLAGFVKYVEDNSLDYSKLKLWVTGYSRGGAVANLFTSLLDYTIENDSSIFPGLAKDKIFTYTFEAPLCYENKVDDTTDYSNIINVNNGRDFIPNLPPAKYGFKLNGQKVALGDDATDDQLLEKMQLLIEDFEMPSFSAIDPRDTETEMTPQEYYDYLINDFITVEMTPEQKEEGKIVDLSTRANYVAYIEPHIGYVMSLIMNLTSSQMESLKTYLTDNIFSLMAILSQDKDSLYQFIKDGLTNAGYTQYVDSELHEHCDGLQLVIYSLGVMHGGIPGLLPTIIQTYSNAGYIVFQHCQEGMLSYIRVLEDKKN